MIIHYAVDMVKIPGAFAYDYAGVIATNGSDWDTAYFPAFDSRQKKILRILKDKAPSRKALKYLTETQSPHEAMMGPVTKTDQYSSLRQCCEAVINGLEEGD